MATITDRIKQIIEIKNLTPSRLADAINVNRSRLSHILTGRNNPSLEMVQSILNCFPDINPEWLLFGQGNTFRSENDNSAVSFGGLFEQPKPSEIKIQQHSKEAEKKIKSEKSDSAKFQLQESENQDDKKDISEQKTEKFLSNFHQGKEFIKRRIKMITIFYDDNEYEIFYPDK